MRRPARALLGIALAGAALLASRPSDAAGPGPAGAGTSGQDDEQGCLRCHEDVQAEIALPVEHMPAAEGMCASCHSPHAARFEHLLNRRERALCYACHSEAIDSFQAGSVHTPVRQGQCGVCHQVHGSQHEKLLSATGNELCLSCHTEHAARQQMQTTHAPFVDGECTDCHAAHNSPNPNQLAAPTEALCRLCHQPSSAALVESHHGIPVDGTRCMECHDAHASAGSELLLPVAHQPFSDGECDMCHLVDSETPKLPRATGARLCGACHAEVPRPRDTVVHAPVKDGNCEACHVPHASKNKALLVKELRATCASCHTEIEERARTSRSVHPLKAEDGSCLGCHDPHGTDFPMHLRGDQTRGLCLECHQTDH